MGEGTLASSGALTSGRFAAVCVEKDEKREFSRMKRESPQMAEGNATLS
jgi:hypothetical protein